MKQINKSHSHYVVLFPPKHLELFPLTESDRVSMELC